MNLSLPQLLTTLFTGKDGDQSSTKFKLRQPPTSPSSSFCTGKGGREKRYADSTNSLIIFTVTTTVWPMLSFEKLAWALRVARGTSSKPKSSLNGKMDSELKSSFASITRASRRSPGSRTGTAAGQQ